MCQAVCYLFSRPRSRSSELPACTTLCFYPRFDFSPSLYHHVGFSWRCSPEGVVHSAGCKHSLTHTDSLYVRERAAQRRERERETNLTFKWMLFTDWQWHGGIFSAEGTKLHCCLQTTHTHVYEWSQQDNYESCTKNLQRPETYRHLLFGSVQYKTLDVAELNWNREFHEFLYAPKFLNWNSGSTLMKAEPVNENAHSKVAKTPLKQSN